MTIMTHRNYMTLRMYQEDIKGKKSKSLLDFALKTFDMSNTTRMLIRGDLEKSTQTVSKLANEFNNYNPDKHTVYFKYSNWDYWVRVLEPVVTFRPGIEYHIVDSKLPMIAKNHILRIFDINLWPFKCTTY